ncbi:PLP-dependent aminotransferase family protein [Streptomyces smyrnaeus]|uniref:PLP-dependent aminotransferase family protein n=1 Tax=Streptomyces smyrnaeus TaxID=1387713 RepID=A0ABS3Y4D1_9ACTN|nr:PLP-dependent aminotransferase family protein [Streptomyces smyrnaeus]MBO8202517.1 PLP-dependent aminotransferase family protein [Streptomyces smyrnaeus]
MADSWANSERRGQRPDSGSDLHLDLAPSSGPGAPRPRAALLAALRDAVRTGRLAPGTRLPSSRTLAADLGLARNTVAGAYGELVAEGWLTARQGSGTRVADRAEPAAPSRPAQPSRTERPSRTEHRSRTGRPAGTEHRSSTERPSRTGRPARLPFSPDQRRQHRPTHDLRTGAPDVSAFPRSAWLASARRALTAAPARAFSHGDLRGAAELRQALAGYLARARGVRADPERIVVCAGFAQGVALLARVVAGEIAVEEYGLPFHRELLDTQPARTRPLPVDAHGARTQLLDTGRDFADVRAVLLTPAHQYPLGVPLHPDRRAAVVDWAGRRGGLVLEDDYDGEFRYDRNPVGALQGLDPERIIYLGTASKALAPALRLAWMVLPDHLVEPVLAAKTPAEWTTGALDQLTLADFLERGAYDRHVRTMRQRYRRRRDRLVEQLAAHVPEARATGIAAGLHAVLRLPPGVTEAAALRALDRSGVASDPLSGFRHPTAPRDAPASPSLVVGYGTPPEHAYTAALDALCGALATCRPGGS